MNTKLTHSGTDVLIDVLLDSPDMAVFLQRLVEISTRELGQVLTEAHCSVTVWRNRRPVTVCSSDPETAVMDEVQYASNQGPCMQTARTGQVCEVVDLRTETRWPRYTRAMTGSPMRSILAIPIALKTAGAAALNTYSPHPGPVPDNVKKTLLDFTAVAARAVTLSVKLQTQAEKSADLAAALESRTAIDLAAGVIMAQTGCDQKQAVGILVKASSNRNEKLRDVALSVLARFNGTTPTTHFDSA
ncbi:GAF and ANTAR domain-containing protein [Arthrobacter sp. ISL-85]|uniref:GAF and ANTAR domain-containing protein n=1 Tax=Arthrobacter sp. ISL-85 TaxID=2819115 RepID=UPI001BED1CFB|nr:GAF and ANTAR domain-containing protein [Arthrobacter sp. ISL-85]MBT2566961.1 GAF and ANTAR domain-containing protein [Arthrobacter sp. ISL-85]